MIDGLKLFLIRFGEVLSAGIIAATLLLMLLLTCFGCKTCEPEVIYQPGDVVEVPVPVTGEASE